MEAMRAVRVFAPAKVNLTLHVTGQRADGLHELDSLVMFADLGDRITLRATGATTLQITGPMAPEVPAGADNLALRAARLFDLPVAIELAKHLPVASGLGGGSSDAAATALGLADLTGSRDLPPGLLGLGADIRVCLTRRAARMQGTGETVIPAPGLPALCAVLANPGTAVSTREVFGRLARKSGAPMPAKLPASPDAMGLIGWLAARRNDLEAPACAIAPEIGETLGALAALPGCALARMSGSGATCFGLFPDAQAARDAARHLTRTRPHWWVRTTTLS